MEREYPITASLAIAPGCSVTVTRPGAGRELEFSTNPPPESDAELAELERLYAASTQGDWHLDPHYQCYIWGAKGEMIADDGGNEGDYLIRMRGAGAGLPLAQNGESIAALHNAFPRLLSAIRQARATLTRFTVGREIKVRHLEELKPCPHCNMCLDATSLHCKKCGTKITWTVV